MALKTFKLWVAVGHGVETVMGDDGHEYSRYITVYDRDPGADPTQIPDGTIKYGVIVTAEEPPAPGGPEIPGILGP